MQSSEDDILIKLLCKVSEEKTIPLQQLPSHQPKNSPTFFNFFPPELYPQFSKKDNNLQKNAPDFHQIEEMGMAAFFGGEILLNIRINKYLK